MGVKRVVSISLGSSSRDKTEEAEFLGQKFLIERIGTDGSKTKFKELAESLDGKVDAIGIGGADLYIVAGTKRYKFRDVASLIENVKQTPVVDGSGLKHTLERNAIKFLQDNQWCDFERNKTLLVVAVDRFGMAQALSEIGGDVVYGDMIFALKLPFPIRSYKTLMRLATLPLPIITRLPIQWFYPTGSKQLQRSPRGEKYFEWADYICGDWHYIRRYAPDSLADKTVITQTLREADLEWLKAMGCKRVITTTHSFSGTSFATNVMEGVLLTIAGKRPEEMSEDDYTNLLNQLQWQPAMVELADYESGVK